MATEADIPVPVCETRGEQVAHFVDNIIKISVSTLPLDKQTQDDKYNELPTVEGQNFLRPPSTSEVHGEVNNVSPDVSKVTEKPDKTVKDDTQLRDQPVELDAEEKTSTEEIQQNVEESNITEIVTSDPDADDVRVVVTQLSKETSINHHGTNESYTENIALTKEILQETTLPDEETESHSPCISEGEELNVQVKTTDEDMSCYLTSEVSKEGEFDPNKATLEKEALADETSAEANSNTAAEEVSQENSTSTETITVLETCNSNEIQSKSDLNSSFSKEEDYGVPIENTLSESHGDVEGQSKTLEDAATDLSSQKLTEKSEESSLIQLEDSQIKHDEDLDVESERLALTEESVGGNNDNVPATNNVKDEDEEYEGDELSENEPSITCTSVKENTQTEIHAESLLVAPENIEVSNLSQEKSIEGPQEEQSTNATLHGNTIEAEEATIDAVDQQKESLESFPPIVSSSPEEGSMNAVLQEVISDHTEEKIIVEDGKHNEILENLSIGDDSKVTEKPDQTIEFAPNVEKCVEEIQQNAAESNRTEKDGDRDVVPEQCDTDSSAVASEMKVGDTLDDPNTEDARVVTQLSKDTSSDHHVTNDSFTENIAQTKEISQDTSLPSAKTESHAPCISEVEELNVQAETTDNKCADEKPTEDKSCNLTSEMSKEGESDQNKVTSEKEVLANERSVEDNFNIAAEEVSQVNSTSTETITTLETSYSDKIQSDINSSFFKEEVTTVQKGDRSVATSEYSGVLLENTLSDSHGDVECQSKTLEDAATDHSDPKLTEKSEESSLVQVDDSKIECDEQVEEESERLPLNEVTSGGTNDNVPAATDNVRDEDEDHKGAELPENEPSTTCTSVKEDKHIENSAESLSDLSKENSTEGPPEEQSTNETLHGNTIEAEEATIDVVDQQKESLESFPPIVSSSAQEGSVNAVLQEVTSDHTDENIDEVDKHKEVLENLSIGEAHSEINNVSPAKDDDEGLKEAELSESEQSTTCASKEDVQLENLAESVHEAPENNEVSNLCQELNIKGPPEEQSTDAYLLGNTIEADEDTIDVVDRQKESLEILPIVSSSPEEGSVNAGLQEVTSNHTDEKIIDEIDEHKEVLEQNLSTTVSTEDVEGNLSSKLDRSENKNKEDLENEIENMSLPPSLAREVSDESKFSHEARFEDGESKKTELCDNEISTVSRTENTEDSLHVASEDTNAPDLGQEKEKSSAIEEQNLSSHQQVIVDERSDSRTVNAAEEKEEIIENLPTIVPNEKTEGNSSILVDGQKVENEEHLDKENEQPSLINDYTGNANTDEIIVQDEVKSEDENPCGAELLEKDKNDESVLLTEEVQSEKPIESLHAVIEDAKASDFGQHSEATGILEEQIPAETSQEKSTGETLQNVVNEDSDKEAKHDINLEEELERPSLTEASKEDSNPEESTILLETKTGDEYPSKVEFPNDEKSTDCTTPKEENLQDAPEDHKTSTSSEDIETTCSLEEQSLAENSQATTSNKTVDAADRELTLENVATKSPHEHIGENSAVQVDCLEGDHGECLEKDNQNASLTEDPKEEINASESKNIDELNNRGEDSIRSDLENEENTESTYVKEEVDVEKPAESLQVKPEDIKQHDSSLDTNTSIEEQIPTTDPQEISVDNTEGESVDTADSNEESLEDNAKYIPDCDKEDNIPIGEVGSQKPSIEASEGNPYDVQSTNITEGSLTKEESIESLQVAAHDIDTPPLSQDRETGSLDEQSTITTPEGIMDDSKEVIADNATGSKDEPPNDKNIANTTLYEDKEENLQVQEDCSQLEQIEDLGNDSENTPFTEALAVSSTESSSVKEEVEKPVEEQILTVEPQETCEETQEKTVDAANTKNNYATTPYEDTKEDSLVQVDGSLLEQKELSEKDSESTSFGDAPKDDITKGTLVREVAQIENPIDSSQVAAVDITAFAPCQEIERSSIDDATGEETQEAQDIAKNVPHEDGSPNENNAEASLIKEDVSIELPQVAAEDTKESCSSEAGETISQEEQMLSSNPRGLVDDDRENKTTGSLVFQKETPKDEFPKEIESAEVKATHIEKEEEGYLKDIQETTAVNILAAHQEQSSNLTADKTPCAEELDVNEDVIGHISDVSNYKQQEPSITEVSEEHMKTSNEHVPDSTNLESEVLAKNSDQVVGEANSFGDKTDSEKIEVLNDGSIEVPTTETPAEIDPRGWTEAEVQVPNEEKEAELIKQEAELDQKNVRETLLYQASEDVSESKEVNDEEKIDLTNCEEISGSSNSEASEKVSRSNVALKEVSASNSSPEPRRETSEEAQTEEAQKQESELQVSELIQDSSVEKIERDAQSCLSSANDSGIIEEFQQLKELPLPAPEENIIKTPDCKESDVVEAATGNECIDHLEQDDTSNSFSEGKNPAEEEQEETIANVVLPVSPIETPGVDHSTTERELTSSEEPCIQQTATGDDEEIKVEKDNNDKNEECEEKISDVSSAAPDIIEARETDVAKLTNNLNNIVDTAEGTVINENTSAVGILVNKRSVTDFETKNDDEAQETKETSPTSEEGQDVGSATVEEKSNYTGSLTEKKSDSNEVAFAPAESKSGYESNNWVLESIAQNQSCGIISETGEESLKAEADIKSDKAMAEDIFEQEETASDKEIMKDDISSEKEQLPRIKAEDEDIEDCDQDSRAEEVITDSHQENEAKQEQQENGKRTAEFIKDGNEIQTISKVSEGADDKAPEDLKEKILTNEAIDGILHIEEQAKSIEEPTTKIDTEKAQELDIASAKRDTQDSNEEGVQIAIISGKESEEHKKKDEICSSDEVQAKDEEIVTLSDEEAKKADTWTKPNEDEEACVESKKIDFASQAKDISECAVSEGAQDIPADNENSITKNEFSEEDYPSKSTEFEVSSASEDISLIEQTSEATIVTTEMQEAKDGTDLGAGVPKATGLENPVVEEENDKCTAMADTSTPLEPPVVSLSKNIPECTVGAPLEAEDQQTKLHDLPLELKIGDSEVKIAEKDDSVNLQSVRDISEDVQELGNESFEDSNNENPVEGDLEEKLETSERQETKSVQTAPVSETLKDETEEKQPGSNTEDVLHEEHKLNSIPNQLESPYVTKTEKAPESSNCQSSVEDSAQHEKKEGSQQIDSPPILTPAQCSDIKTSEKDLLVHVARLDSIDVTEPDASPLPLKDKHVVLEADDTRNLNHENSGGGKNISTEYSQGEHEIVKPSKVEQEEAECGNEERLDQEREGKPESEETSKASLSDLFQVSMRERETSQMADHSGTEKETTSHVEDPHAENSDEAEHENLKADEEKDDEEESLEQGRSDLGSEAPVIVEMGDAEVKVAHKKSHNILSGVGSKVKHSIAKVKKAITGKSSHPKTPSPKKVIN